MPETRERLVIDVATAIEGDHARRRGRRMVTLMRVEDWHATLADVPAAAHLPWWRRRVNLLAEGLPSLVDRTGWTMKLGDEVILEITGECDPCENMDAMVDGLRAGLTPQWRGGVTCRVRQGGTIHLGDAVHLSLELAEETAHEARP